MRAAGRGLQTKSRSLRAADSEDTPRTTPLERHPSNEARNGRRPTDADPDSPCRSTRKTSCFAPRFRKPSIGSPAFNRPISGSGRLMGGQRHSSPHRGGRNHERAPDLASGHARRRAAPDQERPGAGGRPGGRQNGDPDRWQHDPSSRHRAFLGRAAAGRTRRVVGPRHYRCPKPPEG